MKNKKLRFVLCRIYQNFHYKLRIKNTLEYVWKFHKSLNFVYYQIFDTILRYIVGEQIEQNGPFKTIKNTSMIYLVLQKFDMYSTNILNSMSWMYHDVFYMTTFCSHPTFPKTNNSFFAKLMDTMLQSHLTFLRKVISFL